MPFSLVYVSEPTAPLSRQGLLDLLDESREHNAKVGITGLLLYREGLFLQLLEGRQDDVETLYASITDDPRHRDVITVSTRDVDNRQFPGWSMGFSNLDDEPVVAAAFSDVVDLRPDPELAEAVLVRELLELFDRSR